MIRNLQVQEQASPCQHLFSPEAKEIYSFHQNLKNIKITTIILKDLTIVVHLLGENDLRHLLLGLLDFVALLLKPVEYLKKNISNS